MKKILKIIVFIIVILFIINVIKNFFILRKLKNKIDNLKLIEAYSVTIKTNNEETKITKNNNIIKIEKSNNDVIMYFDTKVNELIEENITTGEKRLYTDRIASFNLNLLDINENFLLFNIIMTTNVNNEKCYQIKDKSLDNTIFYISKNTGLTIKSVNKNLNETNEYLNYSFDNIEELNFDKNNTISFDE